MGNPYKPIVLERPDRFRLTKAQYSEYFRNGFISIPGLVSQEDVERLAAHADDILYGRVSIPGLDPPAPDTSQAELLSRFTRIHMLHRSDPVSEQYFLHPRILDVLEGLAGPDVLALQTMLFFNPPGYGGQGWHQDSYYITTYPDTLIGVWLALDKADEENGCVWIAAGSHVEPVYPDSERGSLIHTEGVFSDLQTVANTSHMDDELNELATVAKAYGDWVPAILEPGDVLFFHGHILHRSYPNRSDNNWRRAFVSHYCNARSWVPWNHGAPYEGDSANEHHILARGDTHLPFALPTYGTECAAIEKARERGMKLSALSEQSAHPWKPEEIWKK